MFHNRTPSPIAKLLFAAVCLIFISSITLSSAQEEGPTCALNESQLLGQQWDAVGSTGGTMTDATYVIHHGGVMPANTLEADLGVHAPDLLDMIQGDTDSEVPVLLLIVDDFSTPAGARAHGDYVLEVATTALTTVGSSASIVTDTADIAPDNSIASVKAAIDEAVERNGGPDAFPVIVLNMSFVFLSCSGGFETERGFFDVDISAFLADSRNAEGLASQLDDHDLSLVDFLLDQYDEYDPDSPFDDPVRLVVQEALGQYIADTEQEDPAFNDLKNLFADERYIPLAAAGNFGRSEAFPPGSWETVISVGGSRADTGAHWNPANAGEIMAPAAWFAVSGGEYVAGTSFAAPMASVLTSLLAVRGACDFTPLMDKQDTSGTPVYDNEPYIAALGGAC